MRAKPPALSLPIPLPGEGSRPLVVRFGAMGDMVLVLPLVRALAGRYGCPVDILSNGPWTRPLLEGQPGVGTVHVLQHRSLPFWLNRGQRELVHRLRAFGPQPTWYCDTDERCIDMLERAGYAAPQIARASQLPIAVGEHLIDYWLRFGGFGGFGTHSDHGDHGDRGDHGGDGQANDPVDCGATSGLHDPTLEVSEDDAERLARWLEERGVADRPLFLIQPGNKRTMRRGLRRRPSNTKWWPESRWATVIQALAKRTPNAAILLLGVAQESDLNRDILAQASTPQAFDVAGDLPMPRLLALQARAAAMISVDTGPAHSAAALGCPLVVLFGIADPVRIRPRGGATPVTVLRGLEGPIDTMPSILAITVEQVLQAWDALPKR